MAVMVEEERGRSKGGQHGPSRCYERGEGNSQTRSQDDPFYHCAIAGHADYIVTDDTADFPPPKGRKKPEIITPAEAVVRLRL
jgi:hypothetical protein